MSLGRFGWVFAVVLMVSWLGAATAWAQSAPTCVFDPGSATVTVTVNGQLAEVKAGSTGKIRINGTLCGAATVTNTDAIVVTGGSTPDPVTLSGSFAPGLSPEGDGASEIEISFALGAGSDTVTVDLTNIGDGILFTSSGIDIAEDGDQDISVAGVEHVVINGRGGNDLVNARAYSSGGVEIHGGDGDDRLYGTDASDFLYGDAGDDRLYGRGGYRDDIYGGPGNDIMYGGSGDDTFHADAILDGTDVMNGGAGSDRASYRGRLNPINASLNGLADDGEGGENDRIQADVENLRGGDGNDVLVGSSDRNIIEGEGGADEIYGGAGDDSLGGGVSDDILVGEDGNDQLRGNGGDDVLIGGPGTDYFDGWYGNDTIYNADGEAELVHCGNGTDDAEDDPLDTISIDCEL